MPSIIEHVRRLTDTELQAAIKRGEQAIPLLAGQDATSAFAEMSLTALYFEAYQRAEASGDHEAALEILRKFTDPAAAVRPAAEPRRRDLVGRGKATAAGPSVLPDRSAVASA